MKKIVCIIIVMIIAIHSSHSQWQWAVNPALLINGGVEGNIVRTDVSGNIYAAFYLFTGFGSGGIICNSLSGVDTFAANGYNDLFFAKINNSGQLLWVKQLGGNNSGSIPNPGVIEVVSDIVINDSTDEIYIYGRFAGTAYFGANVLSTGSNISDALFLAKYNSAGICLWAQKIQSTLEETPGRLLSGDNGSIYITGALNTSTYIDTFLLPPGSFFAKIDSSGSCIFGKNIINGYDSTATMMLSTAFIMSIDTFNGAIYMICNSWSDTVQVDTMTLINPGNGIIIAKFDYTGNIHWAKFHGGPESMAAVSNNFIDANGSLLVNGIFSGNVCYIGNDTLLSASTVEMFNAKFDSNGNLIWSKQCHSTMPVRPSSYYVNADGGFYVTGRFHGSTDFGGHSSNASTAMDLFLVYYDSNGNSRELETKGNGVGVNLICNALSEPIITGSFSNMITFDLITLTSPSSSSGMFISKKSAFADLDETKHHKKLRIRPNPNNGSFLINIGKDVTNAKLIIYDANGRIIKKHYQSTSVVHAELSPGVYIVELNADNLYYYSKMVVLDFMQ